MKSIRSTAVAVALLSFAPHPLPSQGAVAPQLPKPVTSCGPAALILITVVNAGGAPVSDATIQVRRARDSKVVRQGEVDLPGEYVVMDDLQLPVVDQQGTRFVVQVRHANQKASAVLRIGRTPDGCHVRLLSGPAQLTLK